MDKKLSKISPKNVQRSNTVYTRVVAGPRIIGINVFIEDLLQFDNQLLAIIDRLSECIISKNSGEINKDS